MTAEAVVEEISDLAADYDEELVWPTLRRLFELQERAGKECERCSQRKPLGAFSRDSRNPDGLRRYCRECDSAAYRARVNADSA